MDQNEKLIQEINFLKTDRANYLNLDKIANPDAKELLAVGF